MESKYIIKLSYCSSRGNEMLMLSYTTKNTVCDTLRFSTDPTGRPSSVRIVAAAISLAKETRESQGEGDEPKAGALEDGGDVRGLSLAQPPRCRASVFEVAMPTIASGSSGRCVNSGSAPSFQAVHSVDLPEEVSSCALSADGQRLAIVLVGGQILTWIVPQTLPSDPENSPPNDPVINAPEHSNDQHQEKNDMKGGSDDYSKIGEIACLESPGGGASPAAPGIILPTPLGTPEFCIPSIPSPQERVYEKALQEYTRLTEAGKVPNKCPADQRDGQTFHSDIPPSPPVPESKAYHLPHVYFLPKIEKPARGSKNYEPTLLGGGGLMVWRDNSNVCRLYRLPYSAMTSDSPSSSIQEDSNAEPSPKTPIDDETDSSGDTMGPTFDISSLPSVEWILPSPVTSFEVCVAGSTLAMSTSDSGIASDIIERDEHGENERGLILRRTASQAFTPIVAIGTQNGRVYVSDVMFGTRMQGLSRHRGRVTSLAFHGRRSGWWMTHTGKFSAKRHFIHSRIVSPSNQPTLPSLESYQHVSTYCAAIISTLTDNQIIYRGYPCNQFALCIIRCKCNVCPVSLLDRFLFSGSDDEMVHIHYIKNGDGGGTTVRCLHDARGSGIVRVACLQSTPLAFAEVRDCYGASHDYAMSQFVRVVWVVDIGYRCRAKRRQIVTGKRGNVSWAPQVLRPS